MQAYCKKTGSRITGTLEHLSGRATFLEDSFVRKADGSLAAIHSGGTEIFWDGQRTVYRDGFRVFLTEAGSEVLERDIELREGE